MGTVKVGGDWAYIDQLDGISLKDGERLHVKWPDGTITIETCAIDRDTFTYNEMGHEGKGPNHKAYLAISYKGVEVRYYLRHSSLLVGRVDSE